MQVSSQTRSLVPLDHISSTLEVPILGALQFRIQIRHMIANVNKSKILQLYLAPYMRYDIGLRMSSLTDTLKVNSQHISYYVTRTVKTTDIRGQC